MKNMVTKKNIGLLTGFFLLFFSVDTVICHAAAVRPDFSSLTFASNDDESITAEIGFSVNFFGLVSDQLYLNNNGNVTFNLSQGAFTPFPLTSTNRKIIAPFFADVDTDTDMGNGNPVQYGIGIVDGYPAWGATWQGVGCYNGPTNKALNVFQVVLIQRYDTGPGNFDIEFNYDQIQWDSGQLSGGNSNCVDGSSARVGYANGTVEYYELPGSGIPNAFLDNGPLETSLIQNNLNSDVLGRYIFSVREGGVESIPIIDDDNDGVPNDQDICPGGDDNIDNDNNGLPDFCDPCPDMITSVDVDATGIILTKNLVDNQDDAQFKLKNVTGIKAAAYQAVADGTALTFRFGPCKEPIHTLTVPAEELNVTYLNMRHTVGNLDVVRCVFNSEECVLNLHGDHDNEALDALLTGEMRVVLEVGGTSYTNSGVWTQHNAGSGSWTKYRKDN
ncbi:MAG: hypothetical protein D3923_00820 [Candidatus Electrothrix sp. AR3]|nr:hypothetical protein [Candidatus Electrothrix sp. AR3]